MKRKLHSDEYTGYCRECGKEIIKSMTTSNEVGKHHCSKPEDRPMKEKNGYPVLIAIVIFIIDVMIVAYGRVHYPLNFQPDTVSFIENLWVLIMGELIFTFAWVLLIAGMVIVGQELKREIKSLFKK